MISTAFAETIPSLHTQRYFIAGMFFMIGLHISEVPELASIAKIDTMSSGVSYFTALPPLFINHFSGD
jgi:hypothetical protein